MADGIEWAYEVTESDAPHLHSVLGELCAKAKILKPKFFGVNPDLVKSPLQRFTYENGAFAIPGSNKLIIGDKFREALGHHAWGAEITDELKAAIGHELGHLKYDKGMFKRHVIYYSPLYCAAAAIGGILFYDHLKQKEKEQRQAGAPESEVQNNVRRLWQESDHPTDEIGSHLHSVFLLGKAVAGGLLGFVAGSALFSVIKKRSEFRADRFSAELLDDGAPLIRSLQIFRTSIQAAYKELLQKYPDAMREEKTLGNIYHAFLGSLIHSSDAARIARLEAWSR